MSFKDNISKLKRNDLLSFLFILGAAYVVSLLPILHIPFSWMQTFFHEISHGLMAFLTGGTVRRIELNLDGSGVCTSAGGWRFLVAFAGYAGAVAWGALIYVMVDNASEKSANRIAMLIVGLIVITLLLWARDFITIFILLVMIVPFAIILKTKELIAEKYFMQFSGIYIVLDALKTPTYLLDGKSVGDGATLAKITWLPEIFWVLVWLLLGGGVLFLLFRRHIGLEKSCGSATPILLRRRRQKRRK